MELGGLEAYLKTRSNAIGSFIRRQYIPRLPENSEKNTRQKLWRPHTRFYNLRIRVLRRPAMCSRFSAAVKSRQLPELYFSLFDEE